MAPLWPHKRARADTDAVFGDDIPDPRSFIASTDRSKRPRHSTVHTEDGDDSDVSFASADLAHPRNGDTTVPANLDALDDDRYQEADDLQATQAVARQMERNKHQKNSAAENGIIEEIRCTNFMCHEQLTVTLGPLINFIIGHNGSGKSAVLTALTLCLGGKATATNRGQNLKSFIKEGRDFCTLSVKIKNQGTSAFKPESYGKSIVVERHFNRAGHSGFKLKDVNGKIVSTKKAELEDIIDAFALQIDNPMNVLTQDMARQFLSDSTGKDKFKFFMKGTQLETLSGDYFMLGQNIDVMESKLKTREEDVRTLKKLYEEAKKKATRALSIETMRQKETQYKYMMGWAMVGEEEQKVDEYDAEIERVANIIQDKHKEADEASTRYERAHESWLAVDARVRECQQALVPLQEQKDMLKGQFDANKDSLIQKQADERGIMELIRAKEKTIRNIKAEIQEHRRRQADADGGRQAQKVQELENAKLAAQMAKDDLSQHQEKLPDLERELRQREEEYQKRSGYVHNKQEEIRTIQTTIRRIQQGHGNWMSAYHQNLPNLLRAIDGEKGFQEPPVGPMGRYVQILKPEWSSILEKQSGQSLSAFVVTSKADSNLLLALMRRVNCTSPIYIGNSRPIDTTPHEPNATVDTWLRVLKFTNDLVRNQMIINQGIDQTVLIPDRQTAWDFMNGPPAERKNVRHCFAMHDKYQKQGHAIMIKAGTGAVNMEPIQAWTKEYRMQAEKESQLNAEKASLELLQQELRDLQDIAKDCKNRCHRADQAIKSHSQQTRQLRLEQQRTQEAVDRLEEELNDVTPVAGEIERLEEDLAEQIRKKGLDTGQFEDVVNDRDRINEDQRKLKRELEEVERLFQEVQEEQTKAEIKSNKLRGKREDALQQKNQCLEDVSAAEMERTELERMREEQLQAIEELKEQARSICSERMEILRGETFKSIEKKLQRLIKDREQSERELGGSQEELLAKASEAKISLNHAKAEFRSLDKTAQQLKISLDDRGRRWQKFRRHIASRARITFGYLLSERAFRGQLVIDQLAKNLEIHVEPDITRANADGRQAKTLSGGEKSFSTICLLLALWDAMGSPIRCLDEFDVFMDNVNRDISMKMMIGAARRAVGRQYILITPQAMGNVPLEEDVKIIKMRDPERGQTTLQFNN
ncbi:dna repair protein-like protein rad18 [Delitschia confertaspora ATCC 74209]|uniref:Dna repair protein-like protein rad18 n=1 Tax=Delitschia confertaspora ATCC 74209 TaxID=1513339 RepID=A0A9P4JG32_9PLEO|nr:dna repair protein-like protein rad18 [Delitschia confertaspora ATCC 74209]